MFWVVSYVKENQKYTEAELITQFHLKRVLGNDSPLMQEWLNAAISLNAGEQYLFDMIWTDARSIKLTAGRKKT